MVNINRNWNQRKAFGWIWLALAMILASPSESQAQLLNIYPSQDNPNQTIWIFGTVDGSTSIPMTAHYGSAIRNITATNYHVRDSWKNALVDSGNIFLSNNKPTNQVFALSPLFSSANHPKDIDSITRRLPGRSWGHFSTNTILFSANVTNPPTISTGSASKTIGGIFMNDAAQDEIGIRGTQGGGNLSYTNGQETVWFGSGIMDKPISHFIDSNTANNHGLRDFPNAFGAPYFVTGSSDINIRFYRHVIPEPAEYALVFGLVALGFFLFRQRFQKKESMNER